MKKWHWILIGIAVLAVVIFFLRGSEDTWIKDEKGQYIEHSAPSEVPNYVQEQQDAIVCALALYSEKKQEGMEFSSQCLGTCGDYVVDVVNVPRNAEDDKTENQCQDYREKRVSHFIELDKEGNIFTIV